MVVSLRSTCLLILGRHFSDLLRAGLLLIITSVVALLLTGCSLLSRSPAVQDRPNLPGDAVAAESLIAIDFVNALVQFESKQPPNTVIEMSQPASTFAEVMAATLSEAGYAIRFSAQSGTDADWFDYQISALGEEGDGVHRNYYISVGEIKFKRNYYFQPQGVSPNSSLFVKGADASHLRLNDAVFEQGVPVGEPSVLATAGVEESTPAVSAAASVDSPSAEVQADASTVILNAVPGPVPIERQPLPPGSNVPINIAPQVAEAAPGLSSEQQGRAIALFGLDEGENPLLKRNMADLGGDSNFIEVFDKYRDLTTQTLVFPNDSLRLGSRGKRQLAELVELFDASTDIFSVVGCSLGRTSIAQGNEVLATGRARRVVEALLYAGVPRDSIYDEGCWAGRAFGDELPRRGVLVTLKRERPA